MEITQKAKEQLISNKVISELDATQLVKLVNEKIDFSLTSKEIKDEDFPYQLSWYFTPGEDEYWDCTLFCLWEAGDEPIKSFYVSNNDLPKFILELFDKVIEESYTSETGFILTLL